MAERFTKLRQTNPPPPSFINRDALLNWSSGSVYNRSIEICPVYDKPMAIETRR
jgi:hypothetical protein